MSEKHKLFYYPGEEPEEIKQLLDKLFYEIREVAPNWVIRKSEWDHSWDKTAGFLCQKLGYKRGGDFLRAYGFRIIDDLQPKDVNNSGKNSIPSHSYDKKNQNIATSNPARLSNSRKKGKNNNHNHLWIVLIIILCVLLIGIAIWILKPMNSEKKTSINEYQTFYSNGDEVYCPPEKDIRVDEESGATYYDNLIIAYLLSDISASEADTLAKSIGGIVVGHVSGAINSLQIETNGLSFDELSEKANILMQNEMVDYATYEMPVKMEEQSLWGGDTDIGNEEYPSGNDWWAEAVGAWTAWECYEDNNVGNPITVGVLDCGFNPKHEDFQRDGKSIMTLLNSDNLDGGHATHVSGLIAAQNNDIGVKGIAYPAELICANHNASEDYLTVSNIVHWYSQMFSSANTKASPIVINNSWGVNLPVENNTEYDKNQLLHQMGASLAEKSYHAIEIIKLLLHHGDSNFIIVQAAGNGYIGYHEGYDVSGGLGAWFYGITEDKYQLLLSKTIKPPKRIDYTFQEIMDHVIIVAAVENNKTNGSYNLADFSNYGSGVSIAAPGVHIYSTMHNYYDYSDGTSMAAPIVTGSAALLWSMDNTLTAGEVKNILVNHNGGATAVGVTGEDRGKLYPMLNIGASMKYIAMKNLEESDEPENYVGNDWLSYYQPVFDCAVRVMKEIKSGSYSYNTYYPFEFDFELCGSCSGGLRLGYRLQDIDQNGIPELIIGLYEKAPQPHEIQNDCIIALFTLDNNYMPVQLLRSVVRGMYHFSSLGDFACRGSGGAGDTVGDVYEMRDGELFVIESGGNNSIPGHFYSGEDLHYFHFKCPEGIPLKRSNYQIENNTYWGWDYGDGWYDLRDQSTVSQDEAKNFAWGLENYILPIGELKPIQVDLSPDQSNEDRMDIANQYAINIFLSNFSEQGFNVQYDQSTDLQELMHFAYIYAKINGNGRYNLSTTEMNGGYYYTLPFSDLNTIITRFFDRSLPDTMQYICTEPNEYREFLDNGCFYAIAADGEMYNKFTVVNYSADNGNGTYDVEFVVYMYNGDWWSDTLNKTEIYSLDYDSSLTYPNLEKQYTGHATVIPYLNNGNESFQLLKYSIDG